MRRAVSEARDGLLRILLPEGPPRLWCPPLTHYGEDGALEAARIRAHLRHISPHVKGLLVPGSTGDGWELTDKEMRQLVKLTLTEAPKLGLRVLVGALKTEAQQTLEFLRGTLAWLQLRSGDTDRAKLLRSVHVCGFTVCAPRGKDLSQDAVGRALASFLETGLPLAIYQLPQVTQNEVGPELAAALAARFENFLLFKDSSGADRVALSGQSLHGVFTMRGAERDYATWVKAGGGPYEGFLLASANCFAGQLCAMLDDLSAGRKDAAHQVSARLTQVIDAVFRLVAGLSAGNAFANATKAIDHFCAHGPRAGSVAPPRLHSGIRLPAEVIRGTGEILSRHGLMPGRGYLE